MRAGNDFQNNEIHVQIFEEIKAELARRASPRWTAENFAETLSLHDAALGLDSVAVMELLLFCEQHFGVRLPESFLDSDDKTVGDLIGVIAESTKN